MSITATNLINLALKDSGVIGESQIASSETTQDALVTLNGMLALWNVQNLLSFSDGSTSIAVSGADNYVATQNKPEIDVYYLAGGASSAPIKLNKLTYSEFSSEVRVTGTPNAYNQEITSTGSLIRLNPNPNSGTISIVSGSELGQYALTDTISLPNSYILPVRFNLAVLLCTTFGLTPSQWLLQQANEGLHVIKASNTRIPELRGLSNGRYNIMTNQYN